MFAKDKIILSWPEKKVLMKKMSQKEYTNFIVAIVRILSKKKYVCRFAQIFSY